MFSFLKRNRRKQEVPQVRIPDERIARQFLNSLLKQVPSLNLKFAGYNPSRTRLVYKGIFQSGKVTIRIDTSTSKERGVEYLKQVKEDILYILAVIKKRYPNSKVVFQEYSIESSYNSTVKVEVDGEVKHIIYRISSNDLKEVLPQVLELSDKDYRQGAFRIGESKKLNKILKNNQGKVAQVKIVN